MASVSGRMVSVDEDQVRGHVDEVVRTSVEETLNGILFMVARQMNPAASILLAKSGLPLGALGSLAAQRSIKCVLTPSFVYHGVDSFKGAGSIAHY